jgi:hypothetical protein
MKYIVGYINTVGNVRKAMDILHLSKPTERSIKLLKECIGQYKNMFAFYFLPKSSYNYVDNVVNYFPA